MSVGGRRRGPRPALALLALLVLLGMIGCSVEPEGTLEDPDDQDEASPFDPGLEPEPEPDWEDLSELAWIDGPWVTVCGADTPRRVELVDGVADLTPEVEGAEPIVYALDHEAISYGRLSDDRVEDAVLPATCTVGETVSRSVEVVGHDEEGAATQLPTVAVWPWRSVEFGGVEVDDETLAVTVYEPDDDVEHPHLEGYGVEVVTSYRWAGSSWSRAGTERVVLDDPVGGHRIPGVTVPWPDPAWSFRGPSSIFGAVNAESPSGPFQRVTAQLIDDASIDGFVGELRADLAGFDLDFDTDAVFAREVEGADRAVEFAIASPSGDVVTDYLLAELGDDLLVVTVDQDRRILDIAELALDVEAIFAGVEVDRAALDRGLAAAGVEPSLPPADDPDDGEEAEDPDAEDPDADEADEPDADEPVDGDPDDDAAEGDEG